MHAVNLGGLVFLSLRWGPAGQKLDDLLVLGINVGLETVSLISMSTRDWGVTYSFRGGGIECLLRDAMHAVNLLRLLGVPLGRNVAGEELDNLLILGLDLILYHYVNLVLVSELWAYG